MTNEELALAIQAGERERLVELWEQVRKLVYLRAVRVRLALGNDRLADLDDLMQAGFLGLLAAVERYDPDGGYQFTTLLGYTLKTAFAEATDWRTEKQRQNPMHRAASLDQPVDWSEPDGATLGGMLPDPDNPIEAVEDRLYRDWLRETVQGAINGLPPDERRTIQLRYDRGLTLAEIARREGVTPMEVSRRQERAFRALCNSLRRYKDLRTNFYSGGKNPVEANVLRREELAREWAGIL